MNEQKRNIDCRVCLRYDLKKSQKCFSLFEKYNNALISEKIKFVANIEIRENDGLPGRICPDCLLQLETALIFKQKCETSNKILLSIIQQPSKICRVTFRIPVKKEQETHNVVFDNRTEQPEVTTRQLKVSKNEVFEDIVPVDPIPLIETVDQWCQTDELINEIYDNSKPESEDNVTLLPKNEEVEDEISDREDLVIAHPEDPEVVNETVQNDSPNNQHELLEIQETAHTKKSKAIDLKLICDDCGESFKSKCKIAVHWKKAHLASKLICMHCKRTFKTFKALHVHLRKQSKSCRAATKVRIEGLGKDRLFHCNQCPYNTKFIKDMDAHLTTHTGDRPFKCKDCPKSFTQHSSLQVHRESSHKDYRIEATCHYCGKYIKGRNKLYKHLLQHEPKSIQCEVCKKILKCRANLINHMKRHSGVRSYTCEVCSANFFTMGELCNHRRRVHFKEKTFKCDMCEYTSYTAGLLKTHRSRHTLHNVVCLMCGTFVDNEEKLVIHQKRHLEKNFCCPHCDKGFFLKDSLRKHIVKKHTPNKPVEPVLEKSLNVKLECSTEHKLDNIVINRIIS